MFKRILVPVDGSDISNQALIVAIKLAKDQKAKLRIIHVIDEYFVDYAGIGIDHETIMNSIKIYGQELLKISEKLAKKSKIKFESKMLELTSFEGRIEAKIIDEVKAWSADLLVIGTHGRRGFSHLFLGSVAEKIVRISPVPVLLIRGKESKKSKRKK